MNKKDCEILISECEEMLELIRSKFKKAFEDPTNKEIKIPTVKSFLEHSRSILEYSAQDIFHLVIPVAQRTAKQKSKNRNVYFPYGKSTRMFRSSVSSNLPGLKSSDEQIYNLIENLQDYKRNGENTFLSYMCKLTNENKHVSLSESERQSRDLISIGGGAIVVDSTSSVVVSNSNFNGIPSGNFKVENGQITGNINPLLLSETFQYEEGEYVFKDTRRNVIEFLETSLNEIKHFTNNFYKILETKYI